LLGESVDEGLEVFGLGNQGMDTHESVRPIAPASRVDKK